MVRRVFGFYLLRSIYGELRDRSHHTIVYFDLGFLHCLEDTKRYKDKAPGNWVLCQVMSASKSDFLLLPFVCYTVYHRTSPSIGRSESAPSFSLFSIGSNEY